MKALKLLFAGLLIVGVACQVYVFWMFLDGMLNPDLVTFNWVMAVEYKILSSGTLVKDVVVSTEIDWTKTYFTRSILGFAAAAAIVELVAYVTGWDVEI